MVWVVRRGSVRTIVPPNRTRSHAPRLKEKVLLRTPIGETRVHGDCSEPNGKAEEPLFSEAGEAPLPRGSRARAILRFQRLIVPILHHVLLFFAFARTRAGQTRSRHAATPRICASVFQKPRPAARAMQVARDPDPDV